MCIYAHIQIIYTLAISKAIYFSLLNFVFLFRPSALSLNKKAKCKITLTLNYINKYYLKLYVYTAKEIYKILLFMSTYIML